MEITIQKTEQQTMIRIIGELDTIATTEQADELQKILDNARENINYEKLKAMTELKNQMANLSIEIAEKLIRAELSDKPKADTLIQKELELMKLN